MTEIIFSPYRCNATDVISSNIIEDFFKENSVAPNNQLQAYQPYVIPVKGQRNDLSARYLKTLPYEARVRLAHTAGQMGDLTVALSDFYNEYFLGSKIGDWQSISGAGLGAMQTRTNNFSAALESYQKKLFEIRAAYKNKLPKVELVRLEAQAKDIQAKLNTHFRAEMRRFTAKANARRGTVMSNSQRAVNIAKSSRKTASIRVTDVQQAQRLSRFASGLKYAGNGLVVLDAVSRVGTVVDAKNQGKDWQKVAVQESVGMSTGFLAGGYAAGATIGALTFVLGATPVGWVIAVGVGLTVGFGAGSITNELSKSAVGDLYDWSGRQSFF